MKFSRHFSTLVLISVLFFATAYAQGYDGLIPSKNNQNSKEDPPYGSYSGLIGGAKNTDSSSFADLYASGKTKALTPDQKKAANMRAQVEKRRTEKRIVLEKANAERAQKEQKQRVEKERQEKIKSGGR